MRKKPQKILVSGYGWTGSTALSEMLFEYQDISVIPNEFDDFRRPGAIGDAIHSKLNNKNFDSKPSRRFGAMKNYLVPFFIRGLVPDIFWPKSVRGGSTSRKESLRIAINFILENSLYRKCITGISSAHNKEEVFKVASSWIEKIVNLYSIKSKYVVFDQPIIYDCHGEYWPKVFEDSKLILITRNPLDQMGSILRDAPQLLEAPNWYTKFLYGMDSYTNRPLAFFMETTIERYKLITDTYLRVGSENMLVVQFESLVNDYEVTKDKIERFVGIDGEKHINAFKHFKPFESKKRLSARDALCETTYSKALAMEKDYSKMIEGVNAI